MSEPRDELSSKSKDLKAKLINIYHRQTNEQDQQHMVIYKLFTLI